MMLGWNVNAKYVGNFVRRTKFDYTGGQGIDGTYSYRKIVAVSKRRGVCWLAELRNAASGTRERLRPKRGAKKIGVEVKTKAEMPELRARQCLELRRQLGANNSALTRALREENTKDREEQNEAALRNGRAKHQCCMTSTDLSLTDLGYICATVPKAMHNSLWDTRDISYTGCAAQVFFFLFFISATFFLLTIMCYDHYVSICKPLHYSTLLGSRACAHMATTAWATGFLNALMHTANTFSLPLCQGHALGQFICEIPYILQLSCSHSGYLRELGLLGVSACLVFGCFVFFVFSYVQIFTTVLRIPSEQGRHKPFSTCLPHLTVVSLFISTGTFAYLKPSSMSSPSICLIVSVLYSVVPPRTCEGEVKEEKMKLSPQTQIDKTS
ncbi:olfactory receptor 14A16-like [Myiozetetes cayanensis]|uniref:olfactory receptor 14A16-like n=1 Tax=Myiozetetes cayanensis TaxID=478635 RepID=UPI00215FC9EA|nr:olfactory receptor 14A16-like [Myiozetetes cayanensis]